MSDSARAALVRGHVFIVDDEPFGLERVTAVLRRLGGTGLAITTAGSFEGAIETCVEHHGQFGLVLINSMLWPGDADGIALLEELRATGLSDRALIVLYSLSMDAPTRRRALAAGFDDTLLSEDIDVTAFGGLLDRLTALARAGVR